MTDKIDILNRQEFVEKLVWIVRELSESGNGGTFAIDGQWGSGKSYILDMLEKQISLFQDPSAAGNRYIVFRYDCWEYDYYDEPAVAIIAAIRDACENENTLVTVKNPKIRAVIDTAKDLGKELVCNVMETKLGWSPEKLAELYAAKESGVEAEAEKNRRYDTFFEFKSVLNKTREQLSKMAEDKPVIIIVDELDRCIPEYAIKVLERLHHLFENQPNITVVLAYDGTKLSHVIKNIYGIDARELQHFMRKFINFSIHLDNGLVTPAFWVLHRQYLQLFDIDRSKAEDIEHLSKFSSNLFSNTDVRTQEKIISRIMLLHSLSFGELRHPSILYFEMLHQIIWEKYPESSLSWILHINDSMPPNHTEQRDALGLGLYNSIRDLEFDLHRNSIHIQPKGIVCNKIAEDPVSLAFWYIANLTNSTEKGSICSQYYFENYKQYSEIVEAAKKFDALSAIIR